MATELPHAELARIMLDESGYTAMLQAERSAESAGRLENLAELARAMEEYDSLPAFLEHVSLVMDNDAGARRRKVTIMTIHAAKGLEFDNVYLPGWEEGIFPSQRALDEGGLASLEEERRLAYVAITRARKRKRTVMHAANRRIYGQWTSSHPQPLRRRAARRAYRGGDHHDRRREPCGARNGASAPTPSPMSAAHRACTRSTRGPGWQRPPRGPLQSRPRPRDRGQGTRSAVRLGNPGERPGASASASSTASSATADLAQEGNKLEIDFEHAGRKRVLDSFVSAG